ncbi:hypothetical protein PSHT_02400 [Puccinia striiformis]|uniref:4-nitrophenylphosphatase n=1 Tax=Puccinia striiformis TaxID=27350 RepID=A0A2S4WIC1_9BASI|nr:hypothetical protein PSHT_02400 [Puccinia striiformis]
MPSVKSLESNQDLQDFIDRFDNFLFDCDGVIWHGDELIKGVKNVLELLRKSNKKLIFVTNNATKSREAFKAKFDRLGIQAELISGQYIICDWREGSEDELASENLKFCGGTDPADNEFIDLMDFSSIKTDKEVGAVMCGFDMHINYKKLAKAHRYLHENPDCHFILTNDDSTFPTDGSLFPGSGAISAPLRYAMLGKKDPIVVGKPNQPMLDCILEKHKLEPSRSCMIGDRLDTDIAFGINGGLSTLLVLTGVVTRADVNQPKPRSCQNM